MSEVTSLPRRMAQRDRARRAILSASEALLLDAGYEGFSIRRLVDRCGYSAPTIYHHFGDKGGLLDALLEERFEKLASRLRRVPRNGDPVQILRELALAFVRFGLRHPRHYRLLSLARQPDRAPPPSAEEARQQLERAWRTLWEAGRLRTRDVETAGQSLWALAHGLISGHIQRPDGPWSRTLVEDSIDALLRGLVAPEPKRGRGRPRAAEETQ